MKRISLLLFFIVTILFAQSIQSQSQCGSGSVKCSGQCDSPTYIQGCLIYKSKNQCDTCEHNYVKKNGRCNYQFNSVSKSCAQFDYNGECKRCNSGLFLNPSDKQCVDIKIAGCLQKSADGCLNCAKAFSLINRTCVPRINGCNQYSNNGTQSLCAKCADGFELVKGECANSQLKHPKQCIYPFVINKQKGLCQISNCKTHFQWGCIQCNQGFDLNNKNQCVPTKIPGCIDYVSENQCRICQDSHYQIFKGLCYPNGCLQLNSKLQCVNCNTRLGFTLQNGRCVIANCKNHGKDGCSICQDGKTLIRNKCVDQSNLDQTVCVACPSDYFLNSQNNCQKKQLGCKQYFKDNCVSCQQSYVFDSDNKKCIRKVPGCVYNNKAQCISCQKNYAYSQSDKTCFIIGCKTYSANGRCSECSSIWKLTFDNFCSIDNCLEINQNGCAQCIQNFQVNKQGTCSLYDPHCIAKNIYGKCIGCHDGYYVDSSSFCKLAVLGCNYVDGRCTSCKTPFVYQSQTSTCFVDGCKKYFFGGCQTCQQGYELRYNSCKLPHCLISSKGKCLQCDPDYIMRVKTNQCINKDQFCYQYNKDGQCIECAPKYFMSKLEHKCLARQPGCIYDDQDKCSTCFSPFKPIYGQNKCYLTGCLQHNLDSCKQCKYPFVLTDNKYCAIPNCLKNDDQKCTDCFGGYLLEKGLCTTGDAYCKQYDYKTGQCLTCKQGYKVVNNKCQYQDAHCQTFTSKGHCSNCQRLYFLNPLKQCELRDSNCQQYTNGYCTKCKPFYYYFDSLCYQNSQGCSIQSAINKCDKCQEGFTLQKGKCNKSITRLNWNSIDMDFFASSDPKQKAQLEQTFTVGKLNKVNLQPCLRNGYGRLFYSSDSQNIKSACVSSELYGWQPKTQFNEFVGVQVKNKQTFYALDIKCLPNNKLTSFTLQYLDSNTSTTFKRGNTYDLACQAPGVVKTIYFTPVQAFAVRIRVRKGLPNIQIEFYYNNRNYVAIQTPKNETIIQQTIRQTVNAALQLLSNDCKDKQLCWFGLQVCEPKTINGFVIQNDGDASKGVINSVYVDYSVDGIDYTCYNECVAMNINGGNLKLPKAILASKMRVHVVDYRGQPNVKVTFDYN